jgi:hypothetical protein
MEKVNHMQIDDQDGFDVGLTTAELKQARQRLINDCIEVRES